MISLNQNMNVFLRSIKTFGDTSNWILKQTDDIGLPKHGASDVDRVIKSKFFDYVDRRVVAGRKLVCKSNARGKFNFFRKPFYDFAESPNLIFGIPTRNQDISRMP